MSLYGDNRFSHKDAIHDEVVKWYQALFCSVLDLHTLGFGTPDLLVGSAGRCELVEVKSDQGRMRGSQQRFARDWRGGKITVVRSQADVLNHILNMREKQCRIGKHGSHHDEQSEIG